MKQLLNTLFVMTEDAYLALENDNVVIYQNDQTLAKVPLRSIEGIMCLVNTGAVKPGDFEIRENGGVLLSDFGRKKVLTAWQKKKSDQILHPFLQEKISWGLVPYVQALLLARSLRGDLDDYPPFMWK